MIDELKIPICFISYFNNGQTLFIPETFVILKSIDQGKSNSAFIFSKKVKKKKNGMKKKQKSKKEVVFVIIMMINRFNVIVVVFHQFYSRFLVVASPPASPAKQQPLAAHVPILKLQQPILPRERTAVDKVCYER